MMISRAACLVAVVLFALGGTTPAAAQGPQRVTVEWLKSLKSSSNDPSGDAFIGSREQQLRTVEAIVNDSSLVSPMLLFLASRTAMTIDRLEDAAFLFYAAQLRAGFDFERYNIDRQPDGNNAATYLGFLRQTTGAVVNPAIMREPKQFSAAIDRIDRWEMVPSRQAYYPEFAGAKGFKVPAEKWAETARVLKTRFMTEFGRRQAVLLNDKQYFEAFRFLQAMNLGELPETPDNIQKFKTMTAAMDTAERRLFRDTAPAVPKLPQPNAKPYSGPAVRVGGAIPEPKVRLRADPVFPKGARGNVIMEATIGPDGFVGTVRVINGISADADAAAIESMKMWVFEPTFVKGKPAAVIHTVVMTAK